MCALCVALCSGEGLRFAIAPQGFARVCSLVARCATARTVVSFTGGCYTRGSRWGEDLEYCIW